LSYNDWMKSGVSAAFFGGFELFQGLEPVAGFGYDKVKALFAYLAIEDAIPFNRDVLAGMFWPDQPESKALHSLRQALSRLRAVLRDEDSEAPLFLTYRTAIQRNPQANIVTDVFKFESSIKRSLNGEGIDISKLESAVDLYRGELLKGLSLSGAEGFEEWLFNRREYFHRQVVSALERIVSHHEFRLNFDRARIYAEKWLDLEPWREEAHRKLMLHYARTGQRSSALRQYDICRRVLLDRLDLLPDEETEGLYRRIRAMGAIKNILPEKATPFIGREAEISRLVKFLSDPYSRLITIAGPGGVGKTSLALEVGRFVNIRGRHLYLNGVVFVELSSASSLDNILAGIAEALSYVFQRGIEKKTQIIQQLKDKELLIILDNFEHLVHEENLTFIHALLKETQEIKLLVTSRRRLNMSSEILIPLGGLSFPDPAQSSMIVENAKVQKFSAVELFETRLSRIQLGIRLTDEDEIAMIRICQFVEGNPLALELAAAWAGTHSLLEIAVEIERSLDFLKAEWHDLPPRHRSMRAALDVSWNMLEPEEKRVFSYLSVFRNSFTLEASQAVAGASKRMLARLVNKSIIQYDPHQQRYSIHELLQQFGAEKLAGNAAQLTAVQNNHMKFYAEFMQSHFPCSHNQEENGSLDELVRELDNLKEAWIRASERRSLVDMDIFAGGLHHIFHRKSRYKEGIELFDIAIDRLSSKREENSSLSYAWILAYLGDIHSHAGNSDKGRKLLQLSLEAATRVESSGLLLQPLRAFVFSRLGAFTPSAREASGFLEQSLTLFRELGDQRQAAFVLAKLGDLTRMAGDLEKSMVLLEESLRMQESTSSPEKVNTLVVLGLYALRKGDLDNSEPFFTEAAALARKQKDRDKLAVALEAQGMGCGYRGNFEKGVDLFHKSLEIRLEVGQMVNVSNCYAFIALTKLHLNLPKQANTYAQQAYCVAKEAGDLPTLATALWAKGQPHLLTGI
jgi:predicted ATPase/DNA-binding SARP family transcriptional activator